MKYHPLFEPTGNWVYGGRDVYDYGKGQTMMKWSWQEIKWYDSYPEIAYWENLRSVWEDAFKNTLCMEFARVGEHADDVECDYYGSHTEYFSHTHGS